VTIASAPATARVAMEPSPARREARLPVWAPPVVLVLAALVPFLGTLRYGFVYDDVPIIVENGYLHAWSGVLSAWRHTYWAAENMVVGGRLFRPTVQSLYSALWNLGGASPWIFHAFLLGLHVAVTIALWRLLRSALPRWCAFLGALLFAADPVHVEAVANIVGTAEVLVALGTLLFVAVLARCLSRNDREVGWSSALLLSASYFLTIGAKESGAALPALAFLWWWGWRPDASQQRPGFVRVLRAGWRLWLGCALALGAMVMLRHSVVGELGVGSDSVAIGIQGLSAPARAWTMIAAWPLVGALLFWPATLRMHYGHSLVQPQSGQTLTAVICLGVVSVAVIGGMLLARRGERRPLTATAWIVLAYLPASNLLLPTGQLLAERTMYVPSLGAAMLVAGALGALGGFAELPARRDDDAPSGSFAGLTPARVVAAIATILAVAGATRSALGASVWRNNFSVFTAAIAADPAAYRPYMALGSWYLQKGDTTNAERLFDRAHSLYDRDPALALDFAQLLLARGEKSRALSVLTPAAHARSDLAMLRVTYLATLLEVRGADSVIADIRSQHGPDAARATRFLFLARAFERKGQPDSAANVLRAAVDSEPRDGPLHFMSASALERVGRFAAADTQLAAARRIGGIPPVSALALEAQIRLGLGDPVAAQRAASNALELAPTDTTLLRLAREAQARLATTR
jgi:Flp pilus assembly protein TadD